MQVRSLHCSELQPLVSFVGPTSTATSSSDENTMATSSPPNFLGRATALIDEQDTPQIAKLRRLVSDASPSTDAGSYTTDSSADDELLSAKLGALGASTRSSASARYAGYAAGGSPVGGAGGAATDRTDLLGRLQEAARQRLRLEAAVEAGKSRNRRLVYELDDLRDQMGRTRNHDDAMSATGRGTTWDRCLGLEKELRSKDATLTSVRAHVGILQDKLDEERSLNRNLHIAIEDLKLRHKANVKVRASIVICWDGGVQLDSKHNTVLSALFPPVTTATNTHTHARASVPLFHFPFICLNTTQNVWPCFSLSLSFRIFARLHRTTRRHCAAV